MEMLLRRILATFVTAHLMIGALTSPATADDAVQNGIDAADEAALRGFFAQHGVPTTVQDTLIARLEAGDLWDSIRGDADPVSVERVVRRDQSATILRYPDGSITVQTIHFSAPTDGPERLLWLAPESRQASSPSFSCPRSGTGSHTGCRVDTNNGALRLYFYVDFYFGTASRQARIVRAYGASGYFIGPAASMSTPTSTIVREYANDRTGTPALATATAKYGLAGILTSTITIKFYVIRGNAWTGQ